MEEVWEGGGWLEMDEGCELLDLEEEKVRWWPDLEPLLVCAKEGGGDGGDARRICETAVTDEGPLRMVGSRGGDGAGWPDLVVCG
ncbi:hypothetical protein QJS04_geneDACA011990 [Acorus gramineus]|uniref:Uncharacterized protein n=1 Tax=Acorus gramineus TaxID=55184 RepID=A0AAV9AFB1_ACOGR|nr:hypothetical protein QJS04_geneDACA011990 [Acorus gramineus]